MTYETYTTDDSLPSLQAGVMQTLLLGCTADSERCQKTLLIIMRETPVMVMPLTIAAEAKI